MSCRSGAKVSKAHRGLTNKFKPGMKRGLQNCSAMMMMMMMITIITTTTTTTTIIIIINNNNNNKFGKVASEKQ